MREKEKKERRPAGKYMEEWREKERLRKAKKMEEGLIRRDSDEAMRFLIFFHP